MRLPPIDALRGFIMILMVLGHVLDGLNRSGLIRWEAAFRIVYDWIYFFHMPTLFVLSGLLFMNSAKNTNFWRGTWRRILRLLYPFVLWSYIYFTAKYLAGNSVNTPVTFGEVLWAPLPAKDHFWFIWALFVIQVLVSAMLSLGMKNALVLGGIGWLSSTTLTAYAGPLPTELVGAVQSAPYFFVGIFLSRNLRSPDVSATAVLLSVISFLAIPSITVLLDVQQSSFLVLAPRYVCIISLMISFFWLGTRFAQSLVVQGLAFVGQVSMSIYLLHVFFTSAIRIALLVVDVRSIFVHIIAGTIVGVIVPVVVAKIAMRLNLLRLLGLDYPRG